MPVVASEFSIDRLIANQQIAAALAPTVCCITQINYCCAVSMSLRVYPCIFYPSAGHASGFLLPQPDDQWSGRTAPDVGAARSVSTDYFFPAVT